MAADKNRLTLLHCLPSYLPELTKLLFSQKSRQLKFVFLTETRNLICCCGWCCRCCRCCRCWSCYRCCCRRRCCRCCCRCCCRRCCCCGCFQQRLGKSNWRETFFFFFQLLGPKTWKQPEWRDNKLGWVLVEAVVASQLRGLRFDSLS